MIQADARARGGKVACAAERPIHELSDQENRREPDPAGFHGLLDHHGRVCRTNGLDLAQMGDDAVLRVGGNRLDHSVQTDLRLDESRRAATGRLVFRLVLGGFLETRKHDGRIIRRIGFIWLRIIILFNLVVIGDAEREFTRLA